MNKSNRVKSGLFFGVTMTIFNIGWDLATEKNFTSGHLTKVIVSALIGGALAGLLFGWLIGLFAKSKFVNKTTKIDLPSNENVQFETPANHFKGIEAVGGRLYLTNERLMFKSHKLNFQNHSLSIDLKNIVAVGRYKTLGLVNNGLSITTTQSMTEKFVVEQIDEWVNVLESKMSTKQITTA